MKLRKTGLIVAGILLLGLLALNRSDVTLNAQDRFEINKISSAGYKLQSVLHLNNPNLLSSTIKSIHEDFYLDSVLVGAFTEEINQGIPGRKVTELPIDIRFAASDYNQAVQRDSTNLRITITGEIIFQNLMNGGKIKVLQTTNLPLKK